MKVMIKKEDKTMPTLSIMISALTDLMNNQHTANESMETLKTNIAYI